MTETRDLNEQLDHLRKVHSAMARNATAETMIGVSWILIDYMLWTIDHRQAPVDPYRPKTKPFERGQLYSVISQSGSGSAVDLLGDVLRDLDQAEAKIREVGLD